MLTQTDRQEKAHTKKKNEKRLIQALRNNSVEIFFHIHINIQIFALPT